MSVASLQADASVGAYKAPRAGAGDLYAIGAAPLFLDVHVVFVSCLTGASYATGLGLLSRIVTLLQETPALDANAVPAIAGRMDRLVIEYVSLDFGQSNSLATLMGLKGLPFLVYRLRRLPFEGSAIAGVVPAVEHTPPPKTRAG